MKITRSIAAYSRRFACFAILGLGSVTLNAREGGQEANATLINFSAAENLKAADAAGILAKRLDLRAGVDELQTAYVEHPGNGLEAHRFNQYFKGLRVAHGTYTLSSKDGIAAFAFGKYYNVPAATGVDPALSEADALAKAIQAIKANKYMWEVDQTMAVPKGALQFVEDFSYGEPDGTVHLAYAFDIYASEPMSRDMVYVDAQSGKILFRDAIMKGVTSTAASLYSGPVTFESQLTGGVYYLHDLTRGGGVYTYSLNSSTSTSASTEVTSTTPAFTKDAAIDAHWAAERTYDYWKTVRSRNGWDGGNGQHISYVHYGSNVVNAFWSGNAMHFGDGGGAYGAVVSVDVCAHELGHGVCQATAGLIYSSESGGMNEGFSDIWGNVIENWSDPHETDAIAKNTWIVGEELGTPFRSMSSPKTYGQPDTYLGRNWVYTGAGCDNSNDNCGVHTNSGVLNYWFYLMSVGGKGSNDVGNNYNVSAIGIDKAATIVYATELVLSNTSNYAACRTASIAAATTLFGACSPEVETVTRAWYAVGVGSNFTGCTSKISFSATAITIDENAATNACAPSHVVNLPIVLNGPAPTGGNAVATITAIGGTAVAGVDYSIASNTVTFATGSTAAQNIPITVFDNAYLGTNKYVDFVLSIAPNGSTAQKAAVLDTVRVTISSDDRAPVTGGAETHSVGVNNSTAAKSSPFLSGYANARGQYIYSATELSAAGVKPGVPISALAFNVARKHSTQPFTGYTIKMAHATDLNFTSSFLSPAFSTLYNGNLTTTVGWNTIPFTSSFTWDGTSSVVVEVCFSNTSASPANDTVLATVGGSSAATAYSSTVSGCGLSLSGSNISYYRPIIRFSQDVAPANVAVHVGDTRTWNVSAKQTAYFYTEPSKEIVASVLLPHTDLGCVTAKVTAAGNGFKLTADGSKARSVKEFDISSVPAVTGDTFDVILYFTNDELGIADPNNLSIVQTTSNDDNSMLPSNTNVVVPSDIIYGTNWVGFRGTFSNMKRFYLTGPAQLNVGGIKGQYDDLWTGANPFLNAPVINWSLSAQEHVSIRLTDITGKTVFSTDQVLGSGTHSLELNSGSNYAAGTYILQVVRPGSVFTRQLVKQ